LTDAIDDVIELTNLIAEEDKEVAESMKNLAGKHEQMKEDFELYSQAINEELLDLGLNLGGNDKIDYYDFSDFGENLNDEQIQLLV
jgi:hypothetical protein